MTSVLNPGGTWRKLLITTGLESTWGHSEPAVFLGEWCRRYDRKEVWRQRSSEVVRNHWNDRAKLRRDHDNLKKLYESLLADFVVFLNRFHHVDLSIRQWRTIIGLWLLTYVSAVWDRWECLRIAFDENEQFCTVADQALPVIGPCVDYNGFIADILGDAWNYRIFLEIIESRYLDRCEVIQITADPSAGRQTTSANVLDSVLGPRQSLKFRAVKLIDGYLSRLARNGKALFFESYFPYGALIRLYLNLRQLPLLHVDEFAWPDPDFSAKPDLEMRSAQRLNRVAETPFEAFLSNRLLRDIPIAYLEGFSWLRKRVSAIPAKPMAIFSANAHWHNEVFKLWTAERVAAGAKFVAMEHGGCIPPAFSAMSYEEDIADYRTTWAQPSHEKHRRLPPNKLAGIRISGRGDKLAIVGYEMPLYNFRAEASPKGDQMFVHNEMVCDLYEMLDPKTQAAFSVKPYPNQGWNTRQRFIDRLGIEKVSTEADYRKFLGDARVVVCTYPQTTFSEAVVSGLPSVLMYPAWLWETATEFDSLLSMLQDVGIVFHDSASAARHLTDIWDDPDKWWGSEKVVRARRELSRKALDGDADWLTRWIPFVNQVCAAG